MSDPEFTADQVEAAIRERARINRRLADRSEDRAGRLIHTYAADTIEQIADDIVRIMRGGALIEWLSTEIGRTARIEP